MIKIMCRLSRYPWGFCFWVKASAARRYKSKPFGRAHYSSWGSKVQYKLWIIGFFGGLIINGVTKTSKVLGKKCSGLKKDSSVGGVGDVTRVPNNSCLQQLLNIYTASVAMLHLLTVGIRMGTWNEASTTFNPATKILLNSTFATSQYSRRSLVVSWKTKRLEETNPGWYSGCNRIHWFNQIVLKWVKSFHWHLSEF